MDNGNFFPIGEVDQDKSWFLMDAMRMLDVDAVGLGERELGYGLSYLKYQQHRTKLPIVCSNLKYKATKKSVFPTTIVRQVGSVKVGFFSLMSDQVDLGPSRDSIYVAEPTAAAREAIAELHKQGATVIVLLSQLGRVAAEDLATAVDGIDVLMVGRNVPLIQTGRMIKNTIAVYGGERGQYIGRTLVSLDAKRKMTGAENQMFVLGPAIPEKKEVASIVKSFEDKLNEKLRLQQKKEAAERAARQQENGPDRFLGSALCMRCHEDQAKQWKSTPHARAWQALVNAKKDATPDCIPCHVVGYNKPGGFVSAIETPDRTNVQCENCHGMGTDHEAFASVPRKVTEATCVTCHKGDNDATWNYAVKLPKVIH